MSREKSEFNSLEKAVLQWFAERYKDENLKAQVKAAKLKDRRWTKAGFYIDLAVPANVARVDVDKIENGKAARKGWPIVGPEIKSEDIEDGGGSLLWGKDGRITTIELYAYGNVFKENVRSFELSNSRSS